MTTKRTRSIFTLREDQQFLEVWEAHVGELRGPRKNSHIHQEMAAELQAMGQDVSAPVVKVRIDNFTAKFRRCKAATGPSGGSPAKWPYYERVARIIGSLKVNRPEQMVEDSINGNDHEQIFKFEAEEPVIQENRPSQPCTDGTPANAYFKRGRTDSSDSECKRMRLETLGDVNYSVENSKEMKGQKYEKFAFFVASTMESMQDTNIERLCAIKIRVILAEMSQKAAENQLMAFQRQ